MHIFFVCGSFQVGYPAHFLAHLVFFLRSSKQSEGVPCSRAAVEREHGAESAPACLLHFELPVCTGVSLPAAPRNQFGGNGGAIERESPLPSTVERSYHREELK